MNTHIPELKIEYTPEGSILLEQDSGGTTHRVALNPVHVRHLAEMMGLIPAHDPLAEKTIAMLKRRMLKLQERIQHLDEWLWSFSDTRHADLSYEQTYSGATADMAHEFCFGLDADEAPAPAIIKPAKKAAVQPSLI